MHQVAGRVSFRGAWLFFIVVNGMVTRAYPIGSFLHVAEATSIEDTFRWKQTPFELGKIHIQDWGVAQTGRLPNTGVGYLKFELGNGRHVGLVDTQLSAPVHDSDDLVVDYLGDADEPDAELPSP